MFSTRKPNNELFENPIVQRLCGPDIQQWSATLYGQYCNLENETGNHLNEARSGAESTLTAILGRESALAGKGLTWDDVRASNQRLDPKLNLAQFDKNRTITAETRFAS